MEETRVNKYKEYRDSMIKEDSIALETSKTTLAKSKTSTQKTETTTLPRDLVVDEINEDDSEKKFMRKKKLLKIVKIGSIVLVATAVVVGLVIFGIFAFGGKA